MTRLALVLLLLLAACQSLQRFDTSPPNQPQAHQWEREHWARWEKA